ncbi:MAG: response regulator [Candidatus Hodarchaeales archaeon]
MGNDYDVIVSDYQMPGMDGLELLEKLLDKDKQLKIAIS